MYNKNIESVMTIEQIKLKLTYGDYQILGKVLGISAEAAKQRFFRGDQKSATILQKIIENREQFIVEHSNN